MNENLARRLFGTEDVIGKHLRIGREKPTDTEIVGVASDGKYADISEKSQPYLYVPFSQDAWTDMALTVTTAAAPGSLLPAVRRAVHDVDSEAIIIQAGTLKKQIDLATYPNRMAAGLTASLGALALLLTLVGLYGMIAYLVSRRTHELGIRIALGARRESVAATVLRDGLKLILPGIAVGAALAIFAGRAITAVLSGIETLDFATLLCVSVVMLLASLTALIGPVRRALILDPAVVLRDE